MVVSLFDRSHSRSRSLRRKPVSSRSRRKDDQRIRLAIDELESRRALAITGVLSIGGQTVGSFTDAPTGEDSIGDFVTVSIEGTRGTVIFNGVTDPLAVSVADGTIINTIQIIDASPDFQLTFNGVIRTGTAVPYASDGIVQMGQISTSDVIRGINSVRGPLTNVAITTDPPIGFTQSGGAIGSNQITLAGNQTSFLSQFVCATPLTVGGTLAGAPVFANVNAASYDAGTNTTVLTLSNPTGGTTTQGALTLATARGVEFQLTQFAGRNFSNLNLKDGGGLFTDVVTGAPAVVNGVTVNDVGIVLTDGLLAYSSIGIRRLLDATVLIGTKSSASADGRMFVEGATADSLLFVGPQTTPTAKNSKFELTVGEDFLGDITVSQGFHGVMNMGGDALGTVAFLRGVGPKARLNASQWADVRVGGDFAGSINSTGNEVSMAVSGNVTGTGRINSESDVTLNVGGSVQKGAVISSDQGVTFDIGRNFLGTMQAGSSEMTGIVRGNVSDATLASSNDITLDVRGSILNSAIAADDEFKLDVIRDVTGSTISSGDSEVSFFVGGNVANSRFLGGLNGTIGGSVTKSLFASKGETLDNGDPDVTLDIRGSMTASHVEATSLVSVNVDGSVTKTKFISTTSDVTVDVGVDLKDSTLIAADESVTLTVGRDALNVTVVGDDEDHTVDIGRNFSGSVQSGSGNLFLTIGGSVLKGSSFMTGDDAVVDVGGNFDGTVESQALRFLVEGNVSKASRIVAQQVTDWVGAGTANFGIGGRFDGIVNVVDFDAAPNVTNVVLVGGGAGSSARFYVDRFNTDNLFFNGNFKGNVRVLQDLVANLNFTGDVDRITLGGRVGSYASSNPVGSIIPQIATINVAGRLLYMNTNSYFEALGSGDGVFWNDATKTSSTGALFTGSYGKVVPTLQQVLPPTPPTPQTYTVPSAPGFSAASWQNSPAGILVSFSSSTNNGGLPVVYYEYTTDGGTNWRRFADPTTTSATNLLLTVDSAGNPIVVGSPYSVNVRAVNALGATASSPITVVVPPSAPQSFIAAQLGLGSTSIGINFTAPAGTGGAPVSYEYTTDGGTTWASTTGPGSVTLTNQSGPGALPFVIGQTYSVTVRATNSAGAGPAYSPPTNVPMLP